jgi:hypothetical protein
MVRIAPKRMTHKKLRISLVLKDRGKIFIALLKEGLPLETNILKITDEIKQNPYIKKLF